MLYQVIDINTKSGISFASVFSSDAFGKYDQQFAVIADESGYFDLGTGEINFLSVTAIGYKNFTIDTLELQPQILMQPDTKELSDVTISASPISKRTNWILYGVAGIAVGVIGMVIFSHFKKIKLL